MKNLFQIGLFLILIFTGLSSCEDSDYISKEIEETVEFKNLKEKYSTLSTMNNYLGSIIFIQKNINKDVILNISKKYDIYILNYFDALKEYKNLTKKGFSQKQLENKLILFLDNNELSKFDINLSKSTGQGYDISCVRSSWQQINDVVQNPDTDLDFILNDAPMALAFLVADCLEGGNG